MDMLRAKKANYSQFLDCLNDVVSENAFGRATLGWAVPLSVAEHMLGFCASRIVYPADGAPISQEWMDAVSQDCHQEGARLGAHEVLVSSRLELGVLVMGPNQSRGFAWWGILFF